MPDRPRITALKYKGILVLVLFLWLVGWNGYRTIRHFVAEAYCNTVTNSTLNRDQNPALGEIEKAILWDRHNAEYWNKLAGELRSIRSSGQAMLTDEESYKKQMDIVTALEEAVRLNPFEAEYHALLGWEYSYLWQDPDYHEKWLPAADLSMNVAAYFAGDKDPYLHLTIGNYWVMRSKTILPSDPRWEITWANAGQHYRKAQALQRERRRKDLKDEIESFVWKFYPDEAMVKALVLSDIAEENHEED